MVPEGWKKDILGNLFEFKNGLNAEKEQYGTGYKFVNVMDVFGNDILIESKIIGRVQVSDKQLGDYQLKYGDVLFNRTSETFEEIAMAAVYLDKAVATFGGFVIRGRPKSNEIFPCFSAFLFQVSGFRTQAIKLGQGAVRANIGQKDLAKVSILVPPIREQKKIAQVLSTWDKAIATTEQLLASSHQQKKALMQQLLTGKKRLTGFSGEWESAHLCNMAKIVKGKALSSRNLIDGEIPVIAGGKSSPYKHRHFTHEDVITVSASGAYAGYVSYHPYKIWASDCSVVVTREGSDTGYIYQLLTFRQNEIYSLQSGGAQPHIYPKDLESLKVFVPSLREQKAISSLLVVCDKEIKILLKKQHFLKQEKKALTQQLLTGKRRVKVDAA